VKNNITQNLANKIVDTTYNKKVPEQVLLEAKRSFLNWLGVAIGASRHESVNMMLELADELGGHNQASILGRNCKVNLQFAAMINGMASHIFDFDDTLINTVLHPSAPVWPAILAIAEFKNLSTEEMLFSFVVGCEVEQSIALCLYPSHYDKGWHITGTAGTFGAAAAVGKLIGLDESQMNYALGLAASQPTGLREMFGTMNKPYHPGKAAANGLISALLAQKGFTSSPNSLEAKRGFCQVVSEQPKWQYLTGPWGEHWAISDNSYKPFACGIVTHPGIEAGTRLKNKHQVLPSQISGITLEVHPLVRELTGKLEPKDNLEAKFSIYHCTTVGIIFGKAGEDEFTNEIVNDPKVLALRQKINAIVNTDLKEDQAILTAYLIDGTTITEVIEHVVGSKDRPMTNKELENKFRQVTAEILSTNTQNKLIDTVWQMDKPLSVREILALCTPRA